MHETDLHDLSDDADYAAASLQQGSASMTRSDSSKHSTSSDPEGAELVYLKDNVTIHPTQYASERISGRLKLIKQGSSLFMSWFPYKGHSSNAKISERDKNLYTIRAVAFTEIRSVRRHTPTLGWQYIIVVLSSGLAFPPLYFYNGGVREFLGTIKQHVSLVRSAEDANVFLVNDFQDPLQRTLSSLELPRAVSIASGQAPSDSTSVSPSSRNHEKTSESVYDGSLSSIHQNGRQRQKTHDPARDLSIQVLEKFSLVTRFARETTSQLFRENSDGFGISEKRNHNQSSHNYSHEIATDNVRVPAEIPVLPDPLEVDKLTLVWGKPRQPPMGLEEWECFLDPEGRVLDEKALRKRIFYGGVEHPLRKEVWTLLLGYHGHDSTYAEREYMMAVKKTEYETIKLQWQSISAEQAKRFTKFRERKGLIDKDVVRTDRSLSFYEGDDNPNVNVLRDILLTYSFYNFDLGYCQGMSDLLSPILYIMQDESEAFWCFVSLMERLGPNFNRDQNGMHSQLFALSKKYRSKIMGEQMDFDTLLKFINELSSQIELDPILRDAEALCIVAGENGAASIPPGTPPSLPIEDGSFLPYQDDDDVL
uniref:Rab-GAP TBC domain-containing protein n=1 Tax=Daucus carota subsp. sativus TaxID=79200 RepID=A0A162AA08_DAUCS